MEILLLTGILALGIIFIILEVMVFPGFSIPGIAGVILLCAGIYMGYTKYGFGIGTFILTLSILVGVAAVYFSLRSKTWQKIQLSSSIDSKVDTLKNTDIKKGDNGTTISRLAPIGSVKINGKIAEAKSKTGYIDEGKTVVVIKISKNIIIVKEA